MKLDIYKYSSAGGRANNEDYCDYFTQDDFSAFILADGLGGHDCGEIASEIAVNTAVSALEEDHNANLRDVVAAANLAIKQRQAEQPELATMRTTIVCAKLANDTLTYANIGDSRFYYFKGGRKLLRTKDHSVPQVSVDMGEMNEIDMRYSDDRNKLLKVLGESEDLVIPDDYPAINVAPGDAFVLCSDGLWENVFDMEMEIDLAKSLGARDWAHFMIKRLLLRVSGSHDNFTLICGRII